MDIEWKDGHRSAYSFVFLRDACPCALCQDEREKDGREPGDPLKPVAGALPMFKALARPTEVEAVGKYGIRFTWNDGHQHGIYSWEFLREHCPCQDCRDKPPGCYQERQQAQLNRGSIRERSGALPACPLVRFSFSSEDTQDKICRISRS